MDCSGVRVFVRESIKDCGGVTVFVSYPYKY